MASSAAQERETEQLSTIQNLNLFANAPEGSAWPGGIIGDLINPDSNIQVGVDAPIIMPLINPKLINYAVNIAPHKRGVKYQSIRKRMIPIRKKNQVRSTITQKGIIFPNVEKESMEMETNVTSICVNSSMYSM